MSAKKNKVPTELLASIEKMKAAKINSTPQKIIPIRQWSASKHETFSKCKLRAQLQYGLKIPEPERPLPPGKTEHANDRGTRIHTAAELYVQGKGPMILEMTKFYAEFQSLRALYAAGMVSLEGEWAMSKNWDPVAWNGQWDEIDNPGLKGIPKVSKLQYKDVEDGQIVQMGKKFFVWVPAWLRLKLDAIVFLSEHEAIVIDYKSGKRYGNEIKHAEQTQLYQLVSLLRYPKLEIIHTELWYLDVDELASSTFTRQQGIRFLPSFTKKGKAITECTDFPPSPSVFGCQKAYCPYGSWGTGHCAVGVPRS